MLPVSSELQGVLGGPQREMRVAGVPLIRERPTKFAKFLDLVLAGAQGAGAGATAPPETGFFGGFQAAEQVGRSRQLEDELRQQREEELRRRAGLERRRVEVEERQVAAEERLRQAQSAAAEALAGERGQEEFFPSGIPGVVFGRRTGEARELTVPRRRAQGPGLPFITEEVPLMGLAPKPGPRTPFQAFISGDPELEKKARAFQALLRPAREITSGQQQLLNQINREYERRRRILDAGLFPGEARSPEDIGALEALEDEASEAETLVYEGKSARQIGFLGRRAPRKARAPSGPQAPPKNPYR